MKDLFILRGLPLSGKTKWCIDNNLKDFCISVEYFRDILHSKSLDIHGNIVRVDNNDKIAYSMLFLTLEQKMRAGDTIVIDDAHLSNSYFTKYKEYANKYIYNVYIVDFSSISISEIMQRDLDHIYKKEDLISMQNIMQSNPIELKDITILEPSEFRKSQRIITDLSRYKKIIHIGDIHGSYWALRKCIKEVKQDNFYIFLGDYIDKGIENFEVLKFLSEIGNKKNVVLLEGNHERNLLNFANNEKLSSKEFSLNTLPKLQNRGFSKNDARKFYKLLKQVFCYKYHSKTVICSHGGFSNITDFNLIPANLAIYGCGNYTKTSELAKSFKKNTPVNYYQVFGHRNKEDLEICVEERSYVLESKVEQGGVLRAISLEKSGFKDISVQNKFFLSNEKRHKIHQLHKLYFDILELDSNYVDKNFLFFKKGHIRYKNNGLPSLILIDTLRWEIALRGYPISFFINSRYQVNNLNFPLDVFNQEISNILYISLYENKFITFSKYGLNSENNLELFKEILCSSTSVSQVLDLQKPQSESKADILKNILKTHKCTLVFFTHNNNLVLQEGIKNEVFQEEREDGLEESGMLDYYSLSNIAGMLQVRVKEFVKKIDSKIEFYSFANLAISNDYNKANLNYLSLVFYDRDGRCVPLPTYLTNEWRVLEHFIKECKMHGKIIESKWINNALREKFYSWFKNENLLDAPIDHIKTEFLAYLKD